MAGSYLTVASPTFTCASATPGIVESALRTLFTQPLQLMPAIGIVRLCMTSSISRNRPCPTNRGMIVDRESPAPSHRRRSPDGKSLEYRGRARARIGRRRDRDLPPLPQRVDRRNHEQSENRAADQIG